MGVVVDEGRSAVDSTDVEASCDSTELGERGANVVELDVDLQCQGNCARRIHDVVDATHRQLDRPDHRAVAFDSEHEGSVGRADIDGADIDARAPSVRDGVVRRSEPGRHLVVAAHHLRTRDLSEVPVEAVDDRIERSVMIEMVDFDVREDRPVEREFEMGPVALVGFDDQILGRRSIAHPCRGRSRLRR